MSDVFGNFVKALFNRKMPCQQERDEPTVGPDAAGASPLTVEPADPLTPLVPAPESSLSGERS